MNTRARIGAFAVVLGASFGAGALVGASVDPLRQEEPAHPHASTAPAGTGIRTTVTAPRSVGDRGGADPAPEAARGAP